MVADLSLDRVEGAVQRAVQVLALFRGYNVLKPGIDGHARLVQVLVLRRGTWSW
jgi:hypothetical protein